MAIDDFDNNLGEAPADQEEGQATAADQVAEDQSADETGHAAVADDGSVPEAVDTNPTEPIPAPEEDAPTPLETETLQMPVAAPSPTPDAPAEPQPEQIPDYGVPPVAAAKGPSFVTRLLSTKNGRIGAGVAAVALLLMVLFGTHVICFHNWMDPTCTEPSICSKCGRTTGEPLGHDWHDATCTEPKTCARCGQTEGKALGHDVKEWSVTKEATCTAAGEESGKCTRCKEAQKREIPVKPHSFGEWETVKAATCTEEGEARQVCKECGYEQTKKLEKVEHTPGDWEVTLAAEPKAGGGSTTGEQARRCTVCGEVLETRDYTLSDEELKASFIAACESPSFEDVARYPDDWDMHQVRFTGEVIQVMQDGNEYTLRVNVTEGEYFWQDTIMVYYEAPSGSARILEDDVMTFYGYMHGMYSYESVLGATITVPLLEAMYVE